MSLKRVINHIFELGQLKRQVHAGWWKIGIKQPVTVAEHIFRAAQIGYILAEMEGNINANKVVAMLVIHENAETRIGDQDKIASRYFDKKDAELNAFNDQLENQSDSIKLKWASYYNEFEERTTKEGIVAKDADWLEIAFQAKEYVDMGHAAAQDWINNVAKAVETESAKKLISELNDIRFTDWYDGLKKMTYKKLS